MEPKKTVLADMIEMSYEEQKGYLNSISSEVRETIGSVDDWSPKDVLAHVIHWNAMVVDDLARGDVPPPERDEEYNQMNAKVWRRYKDLTWQEVEEFMDKTQEEFSENLRQLSEDDVANPERFKWLEGRPLWRNVAFTSYYHPLQHVAELYAEQGDFEYANEIQETVANQQARLSESEDWLGTARYNLGCHYAITGQPDKALEEVKKGLQLYPDLKKWAPDDPDLQSLHESPEFISIIASE